MESCLSSRLVPPPPIISEVTPVFHDMNPDSTAFFQKNGIQCERIQNKGPLTWKVGGLLTHGACATESLGTLSISVMPRKVSGLLTHGACCATVSGYLVYFSNATEGWWSLDSWGLLCYSLWVPCLFQ